MAERENLQRWQEWVLKADAAEQRVMNIVEMPQDSAKWLRSQLIISETNIHSESSLNATSVLCEALQMLTCQLDPHQGAR